MNQPRFDPFDFAIVGAGIAGSSVAWRLARHARVVLLERESQPGYHTTGRSAALFMESYGPPAARALTRASRALYATPPQEFGEQPILAPRAVLHLVREGQRALLDQAFETARARSGDVRLISNDEMLALVPVLRADQLRGGMLEAGAADIDVHALHQGFLTGFRRLGGQLRTESEVVHLDRQGHGQAAIWRIALGNGGALEARHVVNAAGAWADLLAQMAGVRPIGILPRRRSAFTFEPPPGVQTAHWPAVIAIDESYYFKPDAGRLLGSPANADEAAPHDVQPEEIDIATGIFNIEQVTTLRIRRPQRTWAGLRSFAPDGELVIGWAEGDGQSGNARSGAGFFWLAGQGGYGIQSAAGASQLACDLLLGRPLSQELRVHGVDPQAMRPGRFG